MSQKRRVTATDLAECCVCEQRVVFDMMRGKRRTPESMCAMEAGERTHAALHLAATRALEEASDNNRCFVATALWGSTDPRTELLRTWRDNWLLKRGWGPPIVAVCCAVSPMVAGLMHNMPPLKKAIDAFLSAVVRVVGAMRG